MISAVGKVCERTIKERWMETPRKKVLVNCQFGFRRGRSCSMNLSSFYSRVVDIVQGRDGWVDGVYFDLKQAFDKVPHQRLLWKIKNCGKIRGRLLEWMDNYLEDREMRTVIQKQN